MEHLRYPEDLFKVQRDLLASYHVTDPQGFYSQEDFWTVPAGPDHGRRRRPAAVLPVPAGARARRARRCS